MTDHTAEPVDLTPDPGLHAHDLAEAVPGCADCAAKAAEPLAQGGIVTPDAQPEHAFDESSVRDLATGRLYPGSSGPVPYEPPDPRCFCGAFWGEDGCEVEAGQRAARREGYAEAQRQFCALLAAKLDVRVEGVPSPEGARSIEMSERMLDLALKTMHERGRERGKAEGIAERLIDRDTLAAIVCAARDDPGHQAMDEDVVCSNCEEIAKEIQQHVIAKTGGGQDGR